jgi:hypothetical protein
LVAFVDFADQGVEDQAVGAELLDGDAVLALVEFVTLAGVFVLAVFRGALELRICDKKIQIWKMSFRPLRSNSKISNVELNGLVEFSKY